MRARTITVDSQVSLDRFSVWKIFYSYYTIDFLFSLQMHMKQIFKLCVKNLSNLICENLSCENKVDQLVNRGCQISFDRKINDNAKSSPMISTFIRSSLWITWDEMSLYKMSFRILQLHLLWHQEKMMMMNLKLELMMNVKMYFCN